MGRPKIPGLSSLRSKIGALSPKAKILVILVIVAGASLLGGLYLEGYLASASVGVKVTSASFRAEGDKVFYNITLSVEGNRFSGHAYVELSDAEGSVLGEGEVVLYPGNISVVLEGRLEEFVSFTYTNILAKGKAPVLLKARCSFNVGYPWTYSRAIYVSFTLSGKSFFECCEWRADPLRKPKLLAEFESDVPFDGIIKIALDECHYKGKKVMGDMEGNVLVQGGKGVGEIVGNYYDCEEFLEELVKYGHARLQVVGHLEVAGESFEVSKFLDADSGAWITPEVAVERGFVEPGNRVRFSCRLSLHSFNPCGASISCQYVNINFSWRGELFREKVSVSCNENETVYFSVERAYSGELVEELLQEGLMSGFLTGEESYAVGINVSGRLIELDYPYAESLFDMGFLANFKGRIADETFLPPGNLLNLTVEAGLEGWSLYGSNASILERKYELYDDEWNKLAEIVDSEKGDFPVLKTYNLTLNLAEDEAKRLLKKHMEEGNVSFTLKLVSMTVNIQGINVTVQNLEKNAPTGIGGPLGVRLTNAYATADKSEIIVDFELTNTLRYELNLTGTDAVCVEVYPQGLDLLLARGNLSGEYSIPPGNSTSFEVHATTTPDGQAFLQANPNTKFVIVFVFHVRFYSLDVYPEFSRRQE